MAREAAGGRRKVKPRASLTALCQVATIAIGVQFGWALQLSLLTPYVQELGIPHQYASLIWLCGPVSGLFVQPVVGHYSDICTSSYGRRRPFIVVGSLLVVIAVLVVGFAADLGYILGDPLGGTAPRAIVIFVCGFWLLDLANNTLQGPCRALLADLTGKDQRRTRVANGFFSACVAIGNILGFLAGAYDNWATVPLMGFTITNACNQACSNLKSAFLVGSVLLVVTTILSITAADEIPWKPELRSHVHAGPESSTPLLPEKPLPGVSANEVSKMEDPEDDDEDDDHVQEALFWELFVAFRDLPRTMWYVLLVEALSWVAWYPFLLYDTDWMGREVYLGEPGGPDESKTAQLYQTGVHMGSLGLMLNSVVLGITSLLIDWMCNLIGPHLVWALADGLVAVCFGCTAIITWLSLREREMSGLVQEPSTGLVVASLGVFSVLGIPYAVAYSVPYALIATYAEKSGMGQGIATGVLNLSIVSPQLVVSLLTGPFDALFGGGNIPSFLLGAVSAAVGCLAAFLLLPKPPPGFKSRKGLRRTLSSPIP